MGDRAKRVPCVPSEQDSLKFKLEIQLDIELMPEDWQPKAVPPVSRQREACRRCSYRSRAVTSYAPGAWPCLFSGEVFQCVPCVPNVTSELPQAVQSGAMTPNAAHWVGCVPSVPRTEEGFVLPFKITGYFLISWPKIITQ